MTIIGHYFLLSLLVANFLANDAYKFVRLQDYLCADEFKDEGDPHITLGIDHESAAIITQLWNSTSNPKIKYNCSFQIFTKERPRHGLYTIITKLKLRRDPKSNTCLDFIQFSSGQRWPSDKICNDISSDGPAGRLIFDERESDVSVHVHINQSQPIYEPLELSMVITSHSDCKNTGDLLCDPKKPDSCISRFFVRDNITNCMYPCKDENSCFHDNIVDTPAAEQLLIDLEQKYANFGERIASQLAELSPVAAAEAMADLEKLLSNHVVKFHQQKSPTLHSSSTEPIQNE